MREIRTSGSMSGDGKRSVARLGDAGMEVVANTPTEFAAVIKSELPRWAKLIKEAGIKMSD
jgi:hypothetical protein